MLLKFRVWNWFKRALKGLSVTSYNMFDTVVDHLLMRWVIWSIKNLESCFFTFLHQRAARRHKLGDLKWCSLRRTAVKMTVFIEHVFVCFGCYYWSLSLSHLLAFKGFLFNWTTKQDFLLQLIQLTTCICMCFIFSRSQNSQGSFSPLPTALQLVCSSFYLSKDWIVTLHLYIKCILIQVSKMAFRLCACQL